MDNNSMVMDLEDTGTAVVGTDLNFLVINVHLSTFIIS